MRIINIPASNFAKITGHNKYESIEKTTQYLMKNWRSDETLQKLFPPQVLSVPKGTTVYGGCGEHMMGDDVGGSYYCPYTHTVILDKSQLKALNISCTIISGI